MVNVVFRKLLNRYFATVNVHNKCYKIISNKDLNVVCKRLKKIVNFPIIMQGLIKFKEKEEQNDKNRENWWTLWWISKKL